MERFPDLLSSYAQVDRIKGAELLRKFIVAILATKSGNYIRLCKLLKKAEDLSLFRIAGLSKPQALVLSRIKSSLYRTMIAVEFKEISHFGHSLQFPLLEEMQKELVLTDVETIENLIYAHRFVITNSLARSLSEYTLVHLQKHFALIDKIAASQVSSETSEIFLTFLCDALIGMTVATRLFFKSGNMTNGAVYAVTLFSVQLLNSEEIMTVYHKELDKLIAAQKIQGSLKEMISAQAFLLTCRVPYRIHELVCCEKNSKRFFSSLLSIVERLFVNPPFFDAPARTERLYSSLRNILESDVDAVHLEEFAKAFAKFETHRVEYMTLKKRYARMK
jgi:hypothetical protein